MDHAMPPPPGTPGHGLNALTERAGLLWTALLAAGALTFIALVLTDSVVPFLALHFFLVQDLPVLGGLALLYVALRRLGARAAQGPSLAPLLDAAERCPPALLALGAALVCAGGTWLVFAGFALSMDEFWARADGTILAAGAGLARIPAEWRGYAEALQPIFARITPDGWWASQYLPVNAALQALGGPLASPLLVGLAVLIAADLARRLLPQERGAPVLCALFMVTSSQLLITGMTPYAMSAHLACNLAWLWLFIRREWWAHLAAMALALLAMGLHQLVFFPLFAAPFLLEAWLTRRRGAAAAAALAIAAGVLFWSAYDTVLYAMHGAVADSASGGGTGTGPALLVARVLALITEWKPVSLGLMAFNLARFVTWQNVLVIPLVLLAAGAVIRAPGVWRAMLAGIVLGCAAMTVLLAYQGHGWGYRYLHGTLGSACLLATYGWYRLAPAVRESGGARALMGAGLALSCALLPLRAFQAASFAAPYIRADRAIAALDADVVLIDAPAREFANDLVRNDPLLRNRPKRMAAALLSDADLAALCREYRVARFADADAARFGLHEVTSGVPVRGLPEGCGGE